MKVYFLLDVYAPKECRFTKEVELDFLPSKNMAFQLLEEIEIFGVVSDTRTVIVKEGFCKTVISFCLKDLRYDGITDDKEFDIIVNKFINEGWNKD